MRTLGFCLLLAFAAGIANAGLDEGKAAYERTDYPTARRELQPLAEQGNAYAQARVGTMYLGGLGVAPNPQEALKFLRKAADQGESLAQGWLGYMYVQGQGVGRNVVEGLRWIRMAADQGDPYAHLTQAWVYRHGHGVAKDEAEERKWLGKAAERFRKAADQGDASAQYNLAAVYALGHGIAIDELEAVKWLRKAVESGHASAQFSLGVAYVTGRSVAKDAAESVQRLRTATGQSDTSMQILLGILYAQADGLVKDEAEAQKWYRKAADQGHAQARFRLIALQKKQDVATGLRSYANTEYRWTVSYPAEWKLDPANPADVRITSPSGDGLCGVRSLEARFATVDEFADFIQAGKAQHFRKMGVAVRDAPKQRISLENGASGIDVTTEILSGGKSRRIYVLADPVGYHIDCETFATNWDRFAPFFARIIGSFSPDTKR